MEKIYYLGSSVRLRVEWKDVPDSEGNEPLLTPDTQEWKLYDGKGTLLITLTQDQLEIEGEGVYYHDYTTVASGEDAENPGIYHLVAKATKGDRVGLCRKTFEVKEA